MFLSEQDKQDINQAIKKVEANTAGELVAVIARTSDDYLYIPLLWASLIALLLPGLFYYVATEFGWYAGLPHWGWGALTDYAELYVLQIFVFCLLAVCFRHERIKMALIPQVIKQRRAHRHAHYCFLEQGLHRTEARNGMLIFVSVAEHHVEILADQGLYSQLDPAIWQKIVDKFIQQIKEGAVGAGFTGAITDCGDVLREYFPGQQNEYNELPDHLIEIE